MYNNIFFVDSQHCSESFLSNLLSCYVFDENVSTIVNTNIIMPKCVEFEQPLIFIPRSFLFVVVLHSSSILYKSNISSLRWNKMNVDIDKHTVYLIYLDEHDLQSISTDETTELNKVS